MKPKTVKHPKVDRTQHHTPPRDGDGIVGTEHDFVASGGKLEDWEERVFRAACKFTVTRKAEKPGKQHVLEFSNFWDAGLNALNDPRALVYAVTESGRSFCIPRDQWEKYSRIWAEVEKSRRR